MKHLTQINILPGIVAASLMLLGTACGRDNVKVYHVESGDTVTPTMTPAAATSAAMPGTMPAGLPAPDNSGQPTLKYKLPAGWNEKELTQMRVASFGISENGKQADVSVIPMGGMAGGNFNNVNRWRGQVGLEQVDEATVQKMTEKVVVAGQDSELFDIGGGAQRIIASVLHRDDTAWFFKISGDGELVEKNKPAFIAFLKSVEFGGLAKPSTMDLSQLPPTHPAIPGMAATAPEATPAGQPVWTIPSGWQPGPLAQFLIAKFIIAGTGDAKAEVNVSSLEGDGGGLLANVNRWRAQLGVAPTTEADAAKLPTVDASGAKATVVEISGTNPRTGKPAQLVGLVLPLGGQTWFYKLMGDAGVVAQQKEALVKFVQSAKYPGQ